MASIGISENWWPCRSCPTVKPAQCSSSSVVRLRPSPSKTWSVTSTISGSRARCSRQPVRTNNDLEGWHNALNRRAKGQSGLPLYLLIELLEKEARLTTIAIRLVSDQKLSRVQRKCYSNIQRKLFEFWDKFDNREISAENLLRSCSHLNGPLRSHWTAKYFSFLGVTRFVNKFRKPNIVSWDDILKLYF